MTAAVGAAGAVLAPEPALPEWARQAVNLADPRLGALAVSATDEFFAAKERMLAPGRPLFVPAKYVGHGKCMDG